MVLGAATPSTCTRGARWPIAWLPLISAALLACLPACPVAGQESPPRCDASLWQHVYHPYRLKVIEACVAVTGTIQEMHYEKDGDDHLLLRLAPPDDSLLDRSNIADERADLVVEPVCEHAVTQTDAMAACRGFSQDLTVPSAGTRVRIVGAYVRDQDHGWMEIHPVTEIAVIGSGPARPQASVSSAAAGTTAVWVNTSSGIYHCPGSRWYGATERGRFMNEAEALKDGYRPAYGATCSPRANSATPTGVRAATPAAPTPSTTVWVNTGTGVYHCPGSRWYGKTKRGRYMGEAEARAHHYRPAYGRRCSGKLHI